MNDLLRELIDKTCEDGFAVINAGFDQGMNQNLITVLSEGRAESGNVTSEEMLLKKALCEKLLILGPKQRTLSSVTPSFSNWEEI